MTSTATIHSATLTGLDVTPVEVTATVSGGMPGFTLLGAGGAWAQECAARVRCAIVASGFEAPVGRTVVQCTPATRGSSHLDLAVAAAVLVATRQVPEPPEGTLFVGELSLDGRVLPVRGMACYDGHCRGRGMALACAFTDQATHVPVSRLADLRDPVWEPCRRALLAPATAAECDVPGALAAPLAVCLGTGRVLLLRDEGGIAARVAPTLRHALPRLTQDECDELERIHSACGMGFDGDVPLRCPHHSVSIGGMVGGGRSVMPGEATLATHGLLVLQEVEMFGARALASLRVALRDREARVVRADGSWRMPAAPALVVATSRDVRLPAQTLLRDLARLGLEEVAL